MADIINLKIAKKIQTEKNEIDDILLDEELMMAMREWIRGIDCKSPNLDIWKPSGISFKSNHTVQNNYAEEHLSLEELKRYGLNIPWQLVQAPHKQITREEIESQYFSTIYKNNTARKVMIVLGSAFFFRQPISRGFLSMLYNSPETKRSKDFKLYNSIKSLIEVGAIIETDWEMEQPVQPKGIYFSKKDNQILLPGKDYLHRFIEVVVWSMRFAVKNYSAIEGAMQKHKGKTWRSYDPTPEILYGANFEGE